MYILKPERILTKVDSQYKARGVNFHAVVVFFLTSKVLFKISFVYHFDRSAIYGAHAVR